MTERYRDYDVFARLYDRRWGPATARHLEFLDAHVLGDLTAGARVLDLCCGTGQLAKVLTDRGHAVTGVDGSDAMIQYARNNAPDATFLVDDARTFRIDEPFDVVVSVYDSLNHVMTEAELGAVFGRVAAALKEGGVFAFDLNMEVKYEKIWSAEFSIVEEREVGIVNAGVDPERSVGTFDATLFYQDPDGRWSRHDLHLEQTWYDEETIRLLLHENGFEVPETRIKQPMPDEPEVAANLLFLARRAGS